MTPIPKIESSWKSTPLENEILLTLLKNQGEILSTDLLRILTNTYEEFTKKDLRDALFRMEVRGLIFVVQIKANVSKIEINRKGNFSEEITDQIRKIRRGAA